MEDLGVNDAPTPAATLGSRALFSRDRLDRLFRHKYGDPARTGWAPSARWRYDYFLPADYYEAVVESLVTLGCRWVDIGGGHQVFPDNPGLARELGARAAEFVALDPSENVLRNSFAHVRVKATLERFVPDQPFDLATMRMVVEHVEDPLSFVDSLAGVLKPGGRVVILTVGRWAPVTVISSLVPFRFHHSLKSLFWPGEPEDAFPTFYRMNTRRTLQRLLGQAGFREMAFARLDDLSVFGSRRRMNALELRVRSGLSALGIPYPEHCILGVYERL